MLPRTARVAGARRLRYGEPHSVRSCMLESVRSTEGIVSITRRDAQCATAPRFDEPSRPVLEQGDELIPDVVPPYFWVRR